MAAVSNKKGVVGSKGRNMPIMPNMSEVVPTMVYSIFHRCKYRPKKQKNAVSFLYYSFLWCIFASCSTEVTLGVSSFLL